MLRVESKNGMIFALDLRDVVGVLYANGVVHFRTVYNQEIPLGGPEWGGIISPDDARAILDQWEEWRLDVGQEDEETPDPVAPPSPVVAPPSPPSPVEMPKEPVELTTTEIRRDRRGWKKTRPNG